jgi:hypothetical protein
VQIPRDQTGTMAKIARKRGRPCKIPRNTVAVRIQRETLGVLPRDVEKGENVRDREVQCKHLLRNHASTYLLRSYQRPAYGLERWRQQHC